MKTTEFCYIEVEGQMYVGKDDGFCGGHGFMEPETKGTYSLKMTCPICGNGAFYEKCVWMEDFESLEVTK